MTEELLPLVERPVENNYNIEISSYLDRLAAYLKINRKDLHSSLEDKAVAILTEHEKIAENLLKPAFTGLIDRERVLRGEAKLGYVFCVDGRLPSIHFGRVVNIWEEPAGLFAVKEEGKNKFIGSADFSQAVEAVAEEGRDLFEIVFAHTSLRTDHVCGYMDSRRKNKEFGEDIDDNELVKKNLEEIERDQIPAITNIFNRAREGTGQNPLHKVAVSAVFDTDTFGTILNFGKENELSTTDLLEKEGLKEEINRAFSAEIGAFGFYKNRFTNANYFIEFYGKIIELTAKLMEDNTLGFKRKVGSYIDRNYQELTDSQKQAFLFSLGRRTAFQYLTGLSVVEEGKHPDHDFAEHRERFATITTGGEGVLGRYDVYNQSFGITASDPESALTWAKIALSLLDTHDDDPKRHVVFISTPARSKEDREKLKERNREILGKLLSDQEILKRIKEGGLLLIPVLVDSDNGKIIEIPIYFLS